MVNDLMEELRIMAEEHDDELCREALEEIEMLKEIIRHCRQAMMGPNLRDDFAMAALTGFISNDDFTGNKKKYTKTSYEIADAMMEARK